MTKIISFILITALNLSSTLFMLVTPETIPTKDEGGGESTSLTGFEEEPRVVGLSSGSSENKLASIEISTDEPSNTENEQTSETETPTKDCGEGKFLNPKTNRCKNLQTISETSTGKTITTYDPETGEATTVKICNDGYYLNEETNRCNKEKTESTTDNKTSSAKTCPEGKFLNPKTNRCKNLQTVSESSTGKTVTTYNPKTGEATTEKICNEGYELDQETNRCKKKKENKGEEYPLEIPPLGDEGKTNFVAIGSVAMITLVGVGFVVFQFRHEIAKFFRGWKRRKP